MKCNSTLPCRNYRFKHYFKALTKRRVRDERRRIETRSRAAVSTKGWVQLPREMKTNSNNNQMK